MVHKMGQEDVQPDEDQQHAADQLHAPAEAASDKAPDADAQDAGQGRKNPCQQGQIEDGLFHEGKARPHDEGVDRRGQGQGESVLDRKSVV